MNEINYGKYSVPETLQQLIDLQADLATKDWLPYGDLLGYYFSLDNIRYLNTPLDLLSFASPGGDGIHYGFLTDFGLVEDLEEAKRGPQKRSLYFFDYFTSTTVIPLTKSPFSR